MGKAVIVFSGGQDSTTVLGKALHDGFECFAISFDYGQKHAIELVQARRIADKLNVPLKVVNMREFGALVAPGSALIGSGQGMDVNDPSPMKHMNTEVHASFVPNRNAMMLTLAHGYAQIVGANTIWTGVCQTDYSGYPDCRDVFIKRLEDALNTGYETNIGIVTPLMYRAKAETFKLAEECGILDLVLDESHTCYNGVRNSDPDTGVTNPCYDALGKLQLRHEWGHGCGHCAACELRAKGWAAYKNLVRIA